jgi:hypothetical protein
MLKKGLDQRVRYLGVVSKRMKASRPTCPAYTRHYLDFGNLIQGTLGYLTGHIKFASFLALLECKGYGKTIQCHDK